MILNVGIVYVRFLFLMKFENSEIFDLINDNVNFIIGIFLNIFFIEYICI